MTGTVPGAGRSHCLQGQQAEERDIFYVRKSRARGGEQGETGEVLYVIPTVIEATWDKGHRGEDGHALQRMGWLSCKAERTRGREGGIPNLEPTFASLHCL